MPWISEPSLLDTLNGLAAVTCDATSPNSGYNIYAIGGEDESGVVAAVEAYDPIAKTWSSVASMPTARLNLAAAAGVGRIYALGGNNGTSTLATHEIYDPAAKTWSTGPSLSVARSGLAAVTGRNGQIYAIGGWSSLDSSSNPIALATVETFNPSTNTWASTTASMTTPRYGLAAVTGPDGLIYAIGGGNSITGTLASVEKYNPASNSWSAGPSLPAACTNLAAAVGPDGLIYAIGGVDANGTPQATVYSLNPAASNPQWVAQTALPAATGFLAAVTGPDGLIYAIGGQNALATPVNTVEALTVATTSTAPDPYIGNGSYQSPDIILLDASNSPIPIGGAPGGAWDTLLQPNMNYPIQAIVYNDANIPAPNTVVGFWSFPGGVGTAGTLLDTKTVTVPANGALQVSSSVPFQTGAAGEHECVAISVFNAASAYFNVDPTTATQVLDPTVPHPAGSGHFGSAWRNTNSSVMGATGQFHLIFHPGIPEREPIPIRLIVSATKVAADWEHSGEPAKLTKLLAGSGATLRLPLFLLPELRAHLPAADLQLEVHSDQAHEPCRREHHRAELHLKLHPGKGSNAFEVSGTIPRDARAGDIFLVNVAAHYPRQRQDEAVVEYLEVIYVR